MMRRLPALWLALLVASPAGACTDFAHAPSTRWTIAADGDRRWLVTPCGDRFFSLGVNVVTGGSPARRYLGREDYYWALFQPDFDSWVAATRARLRRWGFNTAGGWSLDSSRLALPFIPNLELGRQARFHWTDPFSPEAEARLRATAAVLVAPYRGNPYRIGYFTDNEVGWWNGPLYTFYMKKPADNRTKQALVVTVRAHYHDSWEAFTRDFVPPAGVASFDDLLPSTAVPQLRPGGAGIQLVRRWTGKIAGRYYRLVRAALRAADPDALVFGDRLPIYYDPVAVRAMTPYVDAVATNYNVDSPDGWLARYFFDGLRTLTGGKAVLVSEWFFAARENRSGNANNGHLMTVDTQAERVRGALAAAERFAREPALVGLHWFQYHDHPRGGRRDGEDYNFGLIDTQDRPYEALVDGFARVNPRLAAIHAAARPPASPAPSAPVVIPAAAIDAGDRSLAEWPKEEALVRGLVAPGPEIPFGDLYLAWTPTGLALAVIAMDYFDPTLLAWRDEFPRGEAFRIDWGIDAGTGPRRFTLFFIPPREVAAKSAPKTAPMMRAEFCRADDASCAPVPGAVTTYFGSDQPRITAEALLPWAALGLDGPPTGPLRMELAATAFHRSRSMSWSGSVTLAPR